MKGKLVSPYEVIYQNFPHCTEWRDDSFLGVLHEESRLDKDLYWKLEWAVFTLTNSQIEHPRHLTWPVFRIFSATMVSLKANANPEDGYKIAGLDALRSRDFTERFQLVFEGFFRGEQHDLKLAFDERNPLLD
jgi:hypothetical protein